VGQPPDFAAVQIRCVELGTLRVVGGVGIVSDRQFRMVASRGPDDSLAVRKVVGARVLAAVVDAADVGAVNVQDMDAVKVVALAPCDADDALSVGREVEFHRVADVGNATDGKLAAGISHGCFAAPR
jgi:hypothetical protein